ncbi:MAG: class IIb bacteriocin, lactobin A/cerein 7B family [Bacilli bacterium]|nr:class IIb bacteriocin, lactobin A/cerein 7B family [Bacilli bacterium]
MNKLNDKQIQSINGGAIKWGVIAGIGGLASFIIGMIDGWMNPKKCN